MHVPFGTERVDGALEVCVRPCDRMSSGATGAAHRDAGLAPSKAHLRLTPFVQSED